MLCTVRVLLDDLPDLLLGLGAEARSVNLQVAAQDLGRVMDAANSFSRLVQRNTVAGRASARRWLHMRMVLPWFCRTQIKSFISCVWIGRTQKPKLGGHGADGGERLGASGSTTAAQLAWKSWAAWATRASSSRWGYARRPGVPPFPGRRGGVADGPGTRRTSSTSTPSTWLTSLTMRSSNSARGSSTTSSSMARPAPLRVSRSR